MKIRDVLKVIQDAGWILKNQEGSHGSTFIRPGRVRLLWQVTHQMNWTKDEKIYTKTGGPMTKYPILIASTKTGYSAHVPDLPGCIATGRTLEQLKQRMHKAIEMHISAMRADGDEIPEPSLIDLVEVA